MKRKIVVAAIAASLSLSVAACSGTDSGSASSCPKAPEGPVSISYLHRLPDGEGMTKVNDIIARWNSENPNIQVTATKFDGKATEMITKLETDVNSNNAPCLAQLGYAEVPEMFVKGLVQDVTGEAEKYRGDFGGAYGQMTVGDKVVGLPQDSGPLVYLYNEAEFAKLGIAVPTDKDSFIAAAKKAAASGKYIADFTPDEAQFWLSGQAAGAGAVWYSAEGDAWKVDTIGAETQTVAAMWQELLDSKAVLTHDRWGDAYSKALVDGQLIGNIAAAWETGFAVDALDGTAAEGQWRVAQLPDLGKDMTGPNGGSGVAVMKGCANPAEAMQFNAWFNTQVDDLASQGLVPAALKPAQNSEKITRQFGGQDVMTELATANERMSNDFAFIPGFSAVGPKMAEAAAAAANGSGTVADVFTVAQEASIAALKDAGLPVANG